MSIQENDLDMLAMMARLENAVDTTATATSASSTVASSSSSSSSQALPPTSFTSDTTVRPNSTKSATEALKMFTSADGSFRWTPQMGIGLASHSTAAEQGELRRLSNGAASVALLSLARHPALRLSLSRTEALDEWERSVVALRTALNDEEDDEETTDDENAANEEATIKKTDILPPAVALSAITADESVLLVQRVADQLEQQRLASIFELPDVASSIEQWVLGPHGEATNRQLSVRDVAVRHLPLRNTSSVVFEDTAALPHRVWFHLLFGPLLRVETSRHPMYLVTRAEDAYHQQQQQQQQLERSKEKDGEAGDPPSAGARLRLHLLYAHTAQSLRLAELAEAIADDPYNISAWMEAVEELREYPLSVSRPWYEQALFLFPHCGPLCVAYLTQEISQLEQLLKEHHEERTSSGATSSLSAAEGSAEPIPHHQDTSSVKSCLVEGVTVGQAKTILGAALRILNAFARHLPRCASPALYQLFFTFLQKAIPLEDLDMEAAYRTALDKHVGHLIDSTPIWLSFLEWRSSRIRNRIEKQKFMRAVFHRMLCSALDDHVVVRQLYEQFEMTELSARGGGPMARNRFRLDEELEKRMTRAKSLSLERLEAFATIAKATFAAPPASASAVEGGGSSRPAAPSSAPHRHRHREGADSDSSSSKLPPRPYLPRPHRDPLSPALLRTAEWDATCVEEQQMWLAWDRAVRVERESNLSHNAQSSRTHKTRLFAFLRSRLSYFPHDVATWVNTIEELLQASIGQEDSGNLALRLMARDLVEEARFFFPSHPLLLLQAADMQRTHFGAGSMEGMPTFRSGLWQCKQSLLAVFRRLDLLMAHGEGRDTASSSAPPPSQAGMKRYTDVVLQDALLLVGTSSASVRLRRAVAEDRTSRSSAEEGGGGTDRGTRRPFSIGALLDDTARRLVQLLEDMALLGANWMRYARLVQAGEATTAARLVAKFVVHDAEFLAMTMGGLRRWSRAATLLDLEASHLCPRLALDPFSAFCAEWVQQELLQSHDESAAALILQGWRSQLRTMVESTKVKRWSLLDCGVDERFFDACQLVSTSAVENEQYDVAEKVRDVLLDFVSLLPDAHTVAEGIVRERSLREPNHLDEQVPATAAPRNGAVSVLRTDPVLGDGIPQRRWAATVLQYLHHCLPVPLTTAQQTQVQELQRYSDGAISTLVAAKAEAAGVDASQMARTIAQCWAAGLTSVNQSVLVQQGYLNRGGEVEMLPPGFLGVSPFGANSAHDAIQEEQDAVYAAEAERLLFASANASYAADTDGALSDSLSISSSPCVGVSVKKLVPFTAPPSSSSTTATVAPTTTQSTAPRGGGVTRDAINNPTSAASVSKQGSTTSVAVATKRDRDGNVIPSSSADASGLLAAAAPASSEAGMSCAALDEADRALLRRLDWPARPLGVVVPPSRFASVAFGSAGTFPSSSSSFSSSVSASLDRVTALLQDYLPSRYAAGSLFREERLEEQWLLQQLVTGDRLSL